MIIQCEQCQTKFKLDDSKVAHKGIKVRCARCRHVFSVAGAQGAPVGAASFAQNTPVFQIEEELEDAAAPALETASGFESDTLAEEDSSDRAGLLDSFSFAADDEPAADDTPPFANDDADFSLPPVESAAPRDQLEAQKDPDAFDFGDFDFGDESVDTAKPAVAASTPDFAEETVMQGHTAAPLKEEFKGLDFSGDDMFGDVVSTTTEEDAAESISFDLGMDGFADSMGVESKAAGPGGSPATQDLAAENPFSLDDIDFGDELTSVAVQQVSTEELKPGQDLLFAPLATARTKPGFDSGAGKIGRAHV